MAKQNRIQNYLPIITLLVVCTCIYAPLLNNDFIIYDDKSYVTSNPHVMAGLTFKGIIWAFTTFQSYNWHPLTWISHMMDVQLFGLNPAGHHFTSILFHAANSILVYLILVAMNGGVFRSLVVALLFAVHPAHVESVAWVAERKDMLSTFFGFLTILAYVQYTHKPGLGKYIAVVIFFVMGLLSKPMVVSFPIVLLLLDYWPLARWRQAGQTPNVSPDSSSGTTLRLLLEKIPLLVLASASCLVTYMVQSREGAVNTQSPFLLNCGNAIISYVKYLFMLVWPHPLAVIYPFNPDEISLMNVTGAGIILCLLTCGALIQIKPRPYLFIGWCVYLVTLLPVIGFVRIGDHSIADRYTYIPYVGLFMAIVWAADEFRRTYRISDKKIALVTIVLLAVLSFVTIRQLSYWRNSFVLFEHALEVNNENATAHKMLGLAYGARGNNEKAAAEGAFARMLHYRYLVKMYPINHEFRFLLGNAYRELDKLDEAISEYLVCISINPNLSKAYNNMGIAYALKGRLHEAKQALFKAVEINPNNTEALDNLKIIESRITSQSAADRR